MSALPPKADIGAALQYVCLVPKADIRGPNAGGSLASNCRGVECLAPRQRRLQTSQELVQHRVDARLRALFGLRAGQSRNANAADRLVIDDDGKAAS